MFLGYPAYADKVYQDGSANTAYVSEAHADKAYHQDGSANEEIKAKHNSLPLCPAKLSSIDPDFRTKIKGCDFNRKKLPPCPQGMVSLNPNHQPNNPLTNPENPRRRNCTKEWTLLVYMAMDNDLNDYGEEDLGEIFLSKVEDKEHGFDLVVEADLYQRTGKRYAAERSSSGRVTIQKFKDYHGNEQNTGDPKTLENFLAWGIEAFPARHYMLIVSGHGDGFAALRSKARIRELIKTAPQDANNNTANETLYSEANIEFPLGRAGHGIAYDERIGEDVEGDDWLTVSDLRHVLNRISRTYLGGEPLDFYGADACLMQQAEVAFELRRNARFIFGSVPIMPHQGLPYNKIIENFAASKYSFSSIVTRLAEASSDSNQTTDGAIELAKDLPQILVDSYTKTIEEGGQGITPRVMASVIDTEKLGDEFSRRLWEFGKAGVEWLRTTPNFLDAKFLVNNAAEAAIAYQRSTVDFKDFLLHLESELKALSNPSSLNELNSLGNPSSLNELNSVDSISSSDSSSEIALAAFRREVVALREQLESAIVASAWGERYALKSDRLSGLSLWMPGTIMGYNALKEVMANSHFYRCSCDSAYKKPKGLAGGSRTLNYWGTFLGYVFADESPQLKE